MCGIPQLAPLEQMPLIEVPAELAAGDVHVWYCNIDDVRDADLLARYDALMTDGERVRHRRYYFERDRHMFLITRALVRTVLSHYADCEPAAWRFGANEYGRPHIVGPVSGPFFNLSNTPGLVACAVAHTERVGVDVEKITRRTEPLNIASRFFSASEVASLTSVPECEQRERFFALWTLKEAYIKARGMGLAIPLGQFSYGLDDGPIYIRFDPALQDPADDWAFALLRATDEHFLSLAIDDPDARLRARCCVPLVDA